MQYYPDPHTDLAYPEVIEALEKAFTDHCEGKVQMPPKVYITFKKGDFRTMPAYIPSLNIAGVKVVNVHPGNREVGLPTVMAVTLILDVDTGKPTAILNATRLTDIRTGAAGAIATKYLAREGEISLGLVGSGRQAETQLEAIATVRTIREVRVWSRTRENAEEFAARYPQYGARAASLEEACDCDVICSTTPSREPLVKREWIRAGTHINAIGADAPGKEELDPAILKRARVFVDDIEQATHSGEINVPLKKGLFDRSRIAGTIGDVVCEHVGRQSPDEITVFDSTGLAIQDLAIAAIAMKYSEGMDLPFH
ncbi:MAG: ornithine cyclodeaminase family protein [Methanomicrobiaceae archaeon]|nr:ornithine cyclodeaminase family protein [Methanomicrobiaceae archaeon]